MYVNPTHSHKSLERLTPAYARPTNSQVYYYLGQHKQHPIPKHIHKHTHTAESNLIWQLTNNSYVRKWKTNLYLFSLCCVSSIAQPQQYRIMTKNVRLVHFPTSTQTAVPISTNCTHTHTHKVQKSHLEWKTKI